MTNLAADMQNIEIQLATATLKKTMLEQAELFARIGAKRNKPEFTEHAAHMLEVAQTITI